MISESDIVVAMENLILLKIVIRNTENGDEISENEALALNLNFSHESERIVCNVSMKKGGKRFFLQKPGNAEMEKEKDNEAGGVQQERSSLIDVEIVKVMKSKKMMKLNDLLGDVVKLLVPLFRPKLVQIKSRIESLIERGYMKRDDKDLGVLIYLP